MDETTVTYASALPPDAACLTCRTPLTEPGRRTCPKCHRPYHPLDRSTFGSALSGDTASRWLSPPSGTECILAGLLAFYMLYAVSSPNGSARGGLIGSAICGTPVFLMLLSMYLRRRSVCRAYLGSKSADPEMADSIRRGRWRWWPLPMALALILLASVSDWPLRLRFELSREAMEKAVADAQARRFGQPHRVGLYYLTIVDSMSSTGPGGTGKVFFETPSYWLPPDRIGFEYSPSDVPSSPNTSFRIAPKWFCRSD